MFRKTWLNECRCFSKVIQCSMLQGCHRLADFLEAVKKEFEMAATIFKTNCDNNKYGHSCFKYGNYKMVGRGILLCDLKFVV